MMRQTSLLVQAAFCLKISDDGTCAFPGCTEILVDKAGLLLGEVCHICGDKPGAKRYDPAQTEAKRQSFSNLIVLCANHHTHHSS